MVIQRVLLLFSFYYFLPTGIYGWMLRLTDRSRVSDILSLGFRSWLHNFLVPCLNVGVLTHKVRL